MIQEASSEIAGVEGGEKKFFKSKKITIHLTRHANTHKIQTSHNKVVDVKPTQ